VRDFENEGGYLFDGEEPSKQQITEIKNIFGVLYDPNLEEKIKAILDGKEEQKEQQEQLQQPKEEELKKPVKAKTKEPWIYSASKDTSVEQRSEDETKEKEREEREQKEKKQEEIKKEDLLKPILKKKKSLWRSWWKP